MEVVFLTAGSVVLGQFLTRMGVLSGLRGTIYQTIVQPVSSTHLPTHTVTVLLDDLDYWTAPGEPKSPALYGRAPTDRRYLAALLDHLSAAGAPVVALDIDLRSPLPPAHDLLPYQAEDDVLFAAIRNACPAHPAKPQTTTHIVLATSLLSTTDGPVSTQNIYDKTWLGACATRGFIQIPKDIRQAPGVEIMAGGRGTSVSFALAALHAIRPDLFRTTLEKGTADFPYSRFMPENSFRTAGSRAILNGRDVLGLPTAELQTLVAGKVVLIGADWHTLAYWQGPTIDQHPSPAKDMPGVLLHANYVEAMLDGAMAKTFSETGSVVFEVVMVFTLVLVGMSHTKFRWKKRLSVVSISIAVVACSYMFLREFGLFLDFFFPILCLGAHAAYDHVKESLEKRHEEHPEKL